MTIGTRISLRASKTQNMMMKTMPQTRVKTKLRESTNLNEKKTLSWRLISKEKKIRLAPIRVSRMLLKEMASSKYSVTLFRIRDFLEGFSSS